MMYTIVHGVNTFRIRNEGPGAETLDDVRATARRARGGASARGAGRGRGRGPSRAWIFLSSRREGTTEEASR